ncbi:MAG: hypothetical protein KF693_10110 [Nitrospira sp.]|nr:hypothetical protein [Nitrospira sp.]
MNRSCVRACRQGLILSFTALIACAPQQFTTLTVYESPHAFVRLEVDRNLAHKTGHSHPSDISPEQMAAILNGLVFEEPATRLPLYDDLSRPRRHPALTEPEVALLAPLLADALKKAGPAEIVTFYSSTSRSGGQRLVTSGGLFVEQDDLHLLLANYRSPTNFFPDPGVADTMDERLTPLRSIAPQVGRLEFEPRSWAGTPTRGTFSAWLQPKRREIIVRYKLVQPPPLNQSSPTATP